MMQKNFTPNPERVRQRRIEVMEAAWRAKQFPIALLTKEAAQFIEFGLKIAAAKRGIETD